MSVYVIEHSDETPIWKPVGKHRTQFHIVSRPDNRTIASGLVNGKSIVLDLDPGHYRIAVSQGVTSGSRPYSRTWVKDFYHDLTPEAEEQLSRAVLRFTKGRMTTDGARFFCQLAGCNNEATSRVAAIVHEAEHSGVNLLATPMEPADVPPPKVNPAVIEAQVQAEKTTAINRLREAALKG
jgi:hypothetical protein